MSCKIDFMNTWDLRHQGAESRLYFGLHQNNRCVIKYRFPKKFRHPVLERKLTRERTKREKKMIERIRSKSKLLGSHMPRVGWSNEDTILMDEVVGSETVFNYLEREPNKTDCVALLVGKCIAELHNIGIIHGDLTTCNLLIVPLSRESDSAKEKQEVSAETHLVIPIDFGLATGSEHPEDKAVDLHVLDRALLATHYSDSSFFDAIMTAYIKHIDQGQQAIIERFAEVRSRGRKMDNDMEA